MEEIKYDITTATAADIEAIAQFQMDMAMESEGTTLHREIVLKGVSAVIADETKGSYTIARYNGVPIGSLLITREWSDWNNSWYWWIQSVYVKPEYRKIGVFRTMYATLKASAIRNGISEIRLYVDKTNHRAQNVYKQTGMHESHYLMYEERLTT